MTSAVVKSGQKYFDEECGRLPNAYVKIRLELYDTT
jgi:hypothetical protein